jgi:predicted phosphodiesterase
VEIIEPVQVRTWDAAVGNGEVRTMWYYRASVQQRGAKPDVDIADLIAQVKRRRSPAAAPRPIDSAFVAPLSDWQVGKAGTNNAVGRIAIAADDAAREAKRRKPDAVYLLGLGDIVEQCSGHYDQQEFTTELNRRDQMNVARRLIVRWVEAFADIAPRVIVAAVGGNHGENRRKGKSFTDFGDNDDVAVFEAVRDICAASASLAHVSFALPREQLTLTLDIAGTITGIAHGHQARAGKDPVEEWWKNQAFGLRPVGDASVLITGHRHHFRAVHDGPRWRIQTPTMDSGSQWFDETAGRPSQPGQLVFTMTAEGPNHFSVL